MGVVLLSAGFSWCQTFYQATLLVSEDYFDYHPDGTCPDFNPGTDPSLLLPRMVADSLDSDGCPVLGDSILYSYNVGKWFKYWRQGNDFLRPVYSQNGRSLTNLATVAFDTSCKNMVFHGDALTFTYIPGSAGLYRYSNDAFWPLDDRGFGNEPAKGYDGSLISPAPHNYSFTMRIHRAFRYVPGLTLTFGGTDDSWVFINHRLALDLGGIHANVVDSIVLDTAFASKFGLVAMGTYALDVFHTQRQADRSSIVVTVPIVTSFEPLQMHLSLYPTLDDTLSPPGDSIPMTAIIYDDTGGLYPECADSVKWALTPTGTRNYLKTATGADNVLYAIDPYLCLTVAVRWRNPSYPPNWAIVDTVRFYVKPQVTSSVCIEPDTLRCSAAPPYCPLNAPSPLDSLVFSGDSILKTAVALLRDKYGNFIDYSKNGRWNILSGGDVVEITFPTRPYIAQVKALKAGTAFVDVVDTTAATGKKDTLKIVVKSDFVSVRLRGRPIESLAKTKKNVSEFYNLRGQRLPLYGIKRTDGLVIERVVEPTGKVTVRKRLRVEQ
jgi:fibro-slime domain-containing protein